MIDNKPKLIPKTVQEMADFIKACKDDPNCGAAVIIKRRGWGRTMAVNLALNTEDINHKIIQQKQLNGTK